MTNDPGRLPPAFYAPSARAPRPVRDWWLVLHPPYTLWHLAYVVIGAVLAPTVDVPRLLATLLAFFLAVGIAAHALDELQGRPLGTAIPGWLLTAAAGVALTGAVALGVVGIFRVGMGLAVFVVAGVVLAVGYNLELAGGRLHTDGVFAFAWGSFPVLTSYYAQAETLDVAAVGAGAAAFGLSWAQRRLSTPARMLRRRVVSVEGVLVLRDGTTAPVDAAVLLGPLESTLRVMASSLVVLAAALAVARLTTW